MRKPCRHCGRDLPLTEKHFYRRKDRSWDSWCKPCKREYNRQERERRREADFKARSGQRLTKQEQNYLEALEKQRQAQRDYMNRKRTDPDYIADHRERRRKWDEEHREEKRELARMYYREHYAGGVRIAKPTKARRHYQEALTPSEWLSVEIFAQWIEATFPGVAKVDIAWTLGISVREVEHVLERIPQRVRITTVDRAFCRIGRPDLLNTLFPLEVAS